MINERYLVSIIMPTFNSGNFIKESINSVISQTYMDWELIIIDDFSSDNTHEIVSEFESIDDRIIYYRLPENRGAAEARNKGISLAKGQFIAFLDSDDFWIKTKLANQIDFMISNNYLFTCTNYRFINEEGRDIGKIVKSRTILDYHGILRYSPGNSTVIYNAMATGKIFIPNIRKRNDYLMWLTLIKKTKYLYGLNEDLTYYRLRKNSLSYKKSDLVKYHWTIYQKYEKLSLVYSVYLIIHKIVTKSKFSGLNDNKNSHRILK